MSVAKMKSAAPQAVHAELDAIDSAVKTQCSNDAATMQSVWAVLDQLRKLAGNLPWSKWLQFVIQEIPIIIAMVVSGNPIDFAKLLADLMAFLFPVPVPPQPIPVN